MNMKKTMITTMKCRTSTASDGLTRVIASTPDVDRYGDIVASSWDPEALKRYMNNPVIVWGHDYQTPAIGRAESVQVVGKELIATIRWDDSPENDLGRLVKSQFERGFLNSVSVGFQPGKATPRSTLPDGHPAKGAEGFLYEQNQLMEISAVNIPANPQALARRAVQADLGVQKHVMEVTEGEDSWTVTFHKYEDDQTDEPDESAQEVAQYDDDEDDEDEDKFTRAQARDLIRDTLIDMLGMDADVHSELSRSPVSDDKRSTPDTRSDIDPLAAIFGY